MTSIKKAIIWGDSVAKGVVYDDVRGRYRLAAAPAATIVAETLGIEIVNHSRMGLTVTDGLAVAEKDLARGTDADTAIIAFGGNDSDFIWKEISEAPEALHLPKTPSDEFAKKMKHMISLAKRANLTPVLFTLPPIHSEKYFDFISGHGLSPENILKWLGDKNHIYRFHERYSSIISRIAAECGCQLLDIRSAFLDLWNSNELFCADGIHPTEEGQRFIGKAILAQL